jgi:serine/threonine protein phosphatase 1
VNPPEPIARARFDSTVAVIGDIHGCVDLLRDLLDRVGSLPIVCVGDVCDHGPDTKGVIELLIERAALSVRGNHEEWLIPWVLGHGFDSFALNPMMGGRATLASYGVVGVTPREIEAQSWRVPEAHRCACPTASIREPA